MRLLEGTKPVTWVFTGDSVTHGGEFTQGFRNYSEHFAERVRWELGRSSDVIINTALVGERADRLLNNIERRALRFQPDVVSVMIGLIDALSEKPGRSRFRQHLEKLIVRLRNDGSTVLLHTPHRINVKKLSGHADMRAYIKIIREAARELDVPCIDHWDHWKRSKSIKPVWHSLLAPDGFHPNAHGQREMAKLIFRRLGIYDHSSFTCTSHMY